MIDAVTDSTFGVEVTDAPTPVLVEFGASWCPPCRAMAPVLEEISRERHGRLRVVSVDCDENHEAADRLGVMAMPTLILFAGGEPVRRVVGYTARPKLLRLVDEVIEEAVPAR